MACIFRRHKALGVVHVGNTACARVSRSTHKLNHFVQHFVIQVGCFYFQKVPPRVPTRWHTCCLNESLIGRVWVVTDTVAE